MGFWWMVYCCVGVLGLFVVMVCIGMLLFFFLVNGIEYDVFFGFVVEFVYGFGYWFFDWC